MTRTRSLLVAFLLLCSLALPAVSFAQSTQNASSSSTSTPDTNIIEEAQVISVSSAPSEAVPDSTVQTPTQDLTAYILSGPDKGDEVTFNNDFIQLQPGALFYAMHTTNASDGTDDWSVGSPYRLNDLLALGAIFLFLVVVFGGAPGLRGLASLLGSLVLIFALLIPGILQGDSALLVAIGVSGLIIVVGSYITHGFNRTTTAAVLGMIVTVFVTGALAYYFVHAANLSGLETEEEVTLSYELQGTVNMVGLLFGGIMIGLLGILYDIAIGQAVAVEELFRAGVHMTRLQVYARAIRIGREHIGALVNTLAIAYVGSALPLLLLTEVNASYGPLYAINSELFSTEIVRILIGSIGLILGVPITTLIASYMLKSMEGKGPSEAIHIHKH